MPKKEKKPKKQDVAGLLIAACLLIGMGIGWIFGAFVPGLFVGLGVGLLAAAIYSSKKEKKK
jgi:hypothetical protein